jgi:hypothetical protein
MLESPGALFEAAYEGGRVAELDWVCRAAAFAAAAKSDVRPGAGRPGGPAAAGQAGPGQLTVTR